MINSKFEFLPLWLIPNLNSPHGNKFRILYACDDDEFRISIIPTMVNSKVLNACDDDEFRISIIPTMINSKVLNACDDDEFQILRIHQSSQYAIDSSSWTSERPRDSDGQHLAASHPHVGQHMDRPSENHLPSDFLRFAHHSTRCIFAVVFVVVVVPVVGCKTACTGSKLHQDFSGLHRPCCTIPVAKAVNLLRLERPCTGAGGSDFCGRRQHSGYTRQRKQQEYRFGILSKRARVRVFLTLFHSTKNTLMTRNQYKKIETHCLI